MPNPGIHTVYGTYMDKKVFTEDNLIYPLRFIADYHFKNGNPLNISNGCKGFFNIRETFYSFSIIDYLPYDKEVVVNATGM